MIRLMKHLLGTPRGFKYLLPLWPPFLAMGIRIEHVSADFRRIVVGMKLRWRNANYVGTHFGGGLFAMTDPFYMLMLLHALGRDYYVWDKAGAIDFVKPGFGKVTARFEINDAVLADIRRHTAGGNKYFKDLPVEIVDSSGETVARVVRTLYIRLKSHRRPAQP